jgi:hypothetical protein
MTGFRSSPGVSNRNIGREGLGLCWSGSAFIVLLLPRPPDARRRRRKKKAITLAGDGLCLSVLLLSGYITR